MPHNLRLRYLRELNSRLTNPLELGLTRPQQKSFPHIHGLYLLVRSSGLTYIDDYGKTPILCEGESAYQSWQALNPTERYIALIETWLRRANPEIIGERGGRFGGLGNLYAWGTLFKDFPDSGWTQGDQGDDEDVQETIKYFVGDYNFGLLDLFGFVKSEFGPALPKTGWYLNRLERTPFGDAFLAVIIAKFRQKLEYSLFSLQEDQDALNSLRATLAWRAHFNPTSPNRKTDSPLTT